MKQFLFFGIVVLMFAACRETGSFSVTRQQYEMAYRNRYGGHLCAVAIQDDSIKATEKTATIQGQIVSREKGCRITQHGHCWSRTDSFPDYTDTNSTKLGEFSEAKGIFTSKISDLQFETPYFVRSYVFTEYDIITNDGQSITVRDTGYNPTSLHFRTKAPSDIWLPASQFGGLGRVGAISFVINNIAYVGMGDQGFGGSADMWKYDHPTQSWSQIANFASTTSAGSGKKRRYGAAFAIGSKGYAGLGDDGVAQYDDWYEYDPGTNKWRQITGTYPAGQKSKCFAFAIGNYGYVGCGQYGIDGKPGITYSDFMYKFDPASGGRWVAESRSNFGGDPRVGAVAIVIKDIAYVGLGINYDANTKDTTYLKDWWQYNPEFSAWASRTAFPTTPRTDAVGFAVDTEGFVGLGIDYQGNMRTVWYEYDPYNNKWFRRADFMGKARKGAVAFAVYKRGFVTLGVDNNGSKVIDMYEFRP